MRESERSLDPPEQAKGLPSGLCESVYDRAIDALTFLDTEALIALQRECETSEGRSAFLRGCDGTGSISKHGNIAGKHRLLAKLLVQTGQNLRVLHHFGAGADAHPISAYAGGRERAT